MSGEDRGNVADAGRGATVGDGSDDAVQPEDYPKDAVSIVEGSWNWPFAVKQMDLYGETGYAKAMDAERIEVRREGEDPGTVMKGKTLEASYDDPLHYLEAVIRGQVGEGNSLSSMKTNVTVTKILDAAKQSAATGTDREVAIEAIEPALLADVTRGMRCGIHPRVYYFGAFLVLGFVHC
jgi:hypothetical protein